MDYRWINITCFSRTKKLAKDKAEVSTTIANILGDATIPGLFNLVGCIVSFVAYQYFCFTNFCRVTKNKQGKSKGSNELI